MGPQPPPSSPAAIKSSPPARPGQHGEVELPAPLAGSELGDLPAPKRGGRLRSFDLFDDSGVADLPTPKAQAESAAFDPFADVDLPALLGEAGSTDLPALRSSSGRGEVDLPAPMGEEIDLPMAMSDAELPAPKIQSSVPEPMALDSDLPMPSLQRDLPVARDDFMSLDLDGPERIHGGGPIELDLPDGGDLDLDMDLDEPPKAPRAAPPYGAPAVAPFEAPSAGRIRRDSVDAELTEEPELSELSEEGEAEVHRMPRPARPEGDLRAPGRPKMRVKAISIKRPPWLMKAVAALALVAAILGAGFYAGTTKHGLFGVHLIEPFLPGSGDEALIRQAIEDAELTASSDTYAATRQALAKLEAARGDAPLSKPLVARSLLHESYYQVRYGRDAERADIADALRLHLQRRGDQAPRVHVALAADALRNADTTTASSEIELGAQEDPTDPYVDLVAGEIALKGGKGQTAVEAFSRALAKQESARAQWGLARGHQALGDAAKAGVAAQATLKLSPNHAGARVAVAQVFIAEGKIDEAYDLLQVPAALAPVDGVSLPVARADMSAALGLVAQIEQRRGRMGAAREMYDKALELDTSNTEAALGAARLVLLDGLYQEALARFQTVIGSELRPGVEMDPTGKPKVVVQAKLGAAEALVAMDKGEDAKKLLADLETPEPVNADVEIWLGKIAAALGDSEQAVRHLRNAIALEPKAIGAYMALAQHYTETKRPDEAVGVLVEAQQNVEITAEVRRLLGWAELQRHRLDDAITQFQAAIEMEPRDSSAQYGLAIAYRRKFMLEEAGAALAKVEELDSKFPGLVLEKGRLAEARGDIEGAAASYRHALEASPNDAALRSRLGAVLVLSGKFEEAEVLLREVLEAQPYSAEAEHYLGRIELERRDLGTARQHFLRASRLEPDNGLYRMYVAWAALESNEMTTALRELDAALKLDPTLGDAYWLRARIEIRAGTVRDALGDLRKAIELNPRRIEAWAAMGECHYQLGQAGEAIAALEKAVAGDPKRAYWWYRLGRLQLDEGKLEPALASLTTAAELGEQAPQDAGWLADAHRLIGDIYYAQKKRQDAVVQYGRYLELADRDAIDRADVEAKLRKVGQGIP
jgi:tetratricopeptide (TPR) repeat protein